MRSPARTQGRGRTGRGRVSGAGSGSVSGTTLKAAEFKARALAVMRRVHETGEPVTVTSHGRPLVRIEPVPEQAAPEGYGCMKGTCEFLVPEADLTPVPARAWGTLREWRDERGR